MVDKNLRKRFLLFLFGCIGVRTYMVYFAKTADETNIRLLAYITLMISFGFIYLFLSGQRKTGAEVFGDKIWWNNLRPVHGVLYFLFAYNVLVLNKNAWQILGLDVIIGLISFLIFHWKSNNFSKLI